MTGRATGRALVCALALVLAPAGPLVDSTGAGAAATAAPAVPTDLIAAAQSASSITLGWNVSTGATSYTILRTITAGGTLNTVATTTTNSFTDTGLTAATTYYYAVKAVNASGSSAATARVSALTMPAQPYNPAVAAVSVSQINVTWTAIKGATKYLVFRAVAQTGPFANVGSPTTASFSDTGLSAGTKYYYEIQAVDASGTSVPSRVVATLTYPPPPTGLTAVPVTASQINLAWQVPTGAASFVVLQSATSGGPYTSIGTPYSATFANTGLAANTTYYYVVQARDGSGLSVNSAQVSAKTDPAAPTGLTATVVSASQVNLAWSSAAGATSYRVLRATVTGGPYNNIGTTTTATTFSDTGLSPATTYFYTIQAVNGSGPSARAVEASALTDPAPPTRLTASSSSTSEIDLTWSPASGATSYIVQRATTSGGPYSTIGTASGDGYADTNLAPATAYFYVVKAVDASGASVISAEVSTTTMLGAPSDLLATTASTTEIDLSWGAVAGATGYSILRSTSSGGPYTAVGTSPSSSYADTGLHAATTYFYVVKATAPSVISGASTQASATTLLGAPTGVVATAVSPNEIDLTWGSVSGASLYDVERSSTAGGPYTTVGSTTSPTFADTGLSSATTYYYVVQATAATLGSPISSEVAATTLLPAPTGVQATPVSGTEIDLTWNAVSHATGYVVQRATTAGGPYTTVGSPTSSSFADTALSPATAYYYVVKATTSTLASALSSEATATTLLGVPTGLMATAISGSEIDLTWTGVSGATGYVVQRATTSGGPYVTVGSSPTGNFADTGLRPATTYFYVVQATAGALTSGISGEASASTSLSTPTGVVATGVSPSEIDLTWSAVAGATGYDVERGTATGGPYTIVGSPTAASFASTGLSPATTYFYVVRAKTVSLTSSLSNETAATTLLGAPIGVVATAVSTTAINLTWTPVPGAAGYSVERATTSGGPYTAIGAPNAAAFDDTGLTTATTYYYVVQATASPVTSVLSVEVSATTSLATPTGVAATAVSPSEIDLTWSPVTRATGYDVERATVSGGPYTTVGSSASTSFADTGLRSATAYFYVINATAPSVTSAASTEASATTSLGAPTGVSAATISPSQIDLTWNPVGGATGYVVQRATTSGGPYATVGSPSSASFASTGLASATTYYYEVAATTSTSTSPFSTPASATTSLGTPSGLAATSISTSEIDLTWNAVSGATGYVVERSTTAGGPYTTIGSPASASFANTGLSAGTTYFYVVKATASSLTSAMSTETSATTLLAAPTGLVATAASATEVDLSWSAVSGATGYVVQRATTAGGPYITVATPTSASFADTGLRPATAYFYVVQATAPSVSSGTSAEATATTLLGVPANVVATAVSTSEVDLTWSAVAGATGYDVERSTTTGGPYTIVGSPTSASFANTGLSPATSYFYVVRAKTASLTSALSSEVSATTLLGVPTAVVATAVSPSEIDLTWSSVPGAAGYSVERATTSGGPYTAVGSPTAAAFANTGLSPATTYYYVVQATASAVTSAMSVEATATTLLAVPTGVVATAVSPNEIDLTWGAVSAATGYVVERASTSGGPYTTVGSPASTSFADTGLAPATSYFYVVRAKTSSVTSALSSEASAATLLGVPTGVVATAVSGAEIDLAWLPVAGATGYVVQRGTSAGGPFTTVGSPSSVSFANTGLSPATTCFYVVKATIAALSSTASSVVSATTPLGAPTGVIATPVSSSEIDLAWSAVSGATGYVVERSATSGGPYTTVGTPSSASFANTGLAAATTYFYVVKATTGALTSALSTEVSAATFLGSSTGVVATAVSSTEIDLAWSPVAGATSYSIERSTTSGGPYTTVGTTATTAFADTGLRPATAYYYVVKATDGSGGSTTSSEVSATTLLGVPSGVVATAVSTSEIDLTWNAVAGATGYDVERSTGSGGPYTIVGTPTSATFADTGLSAATAYFYVIKATATSLKSALSSEVSATTLLASPTGVGASAASPSEIDLTWTAVSGATSYVVERATTSGGPYTTIGSPTSAHFASTGLAAATTYYYVVEAVDASGTSGPSGEASATTQLAAPSGIVATAVSTSEIDLTWGAVSGATGYIVQRATTSGGPYTTVATPASASFADTGLASATTYYYVVKATAPSVTSGASTQASATTVLGAPAGVVATALSSSSIQVTWSAVSGATGYIVQRATTSGGPYTTVGSPTSPTFTDSGLAPVTTYYYVVEATNGPGNSLDSSEVSACTLPTAPVGVLATPISSSEIDLTWLPVTGATGYSVLRATSSGGPYTAVGTPTATTFANTGLSASTTYYYVVKATIGPVSSAVSSEVSGLTLPAAPTGVVASAISPTEIDLAWSPVSGATGYVVLRATSSGGPFITVGSPTSASFANTGLSPATTYYYVVQATNGSGNSASSSTVSATTQLGTPTGVVATAISTSEIDLTWSAVTGATGYVVERATTSGGPYTTVGSPTTASFANTGLSAATAYYFVVKATAGAVSSGLSGEVSALTLPATPSGLAANAVSPSEIDLSWTAASGATGYLVLRATSSGGPYTAVGSPTSASFASTGLSAATTYFFEVKAVDASGSSAASSPVSASTPLAAPTGVVASTVSPTEIDLAWSPVSGATGYVVQRSSTSGGPYTTVGSPASASFANTGLSAASTYYYVVKATAGAVSSALSSEVSATTSLAAPAAVVATAVSSSEIDLTWSAVTGATGYVVQRSSTSGGPYTTVGSPASASFANTGLSAASTYYYVVKATAGAVSSALSSEVSATTSLAAPAGVVATAVSSSEIDLTWSAVTGATGYVVERGTTSGGPYTAVGSPASTSFANTGLSSGATYFYVVKATAGAVSSALSSEVSALTLPAAPSGVSATAVSSSEIDLTWNAVSGASGYVVLRATSSGGPFVSVGSPTSASFASAGLSPATAYYFAVQATDASGNSASSATVSTTTLLAAPTGVVATPASASEVDLSWNAVSGATGYVVLRGSTSGGPYTTVGTPTTTAFANTGLSAATTYFYVVKATGGSVTSAASSEASALTMPAAPSGVVATAVSSSEIDLVWTPVPGATSYVVLRATSSGGPYTAVGTPTSAGFASTGLSPGTSYFYVVEATDGSGNSANSAVASAATGVSAPTGVVATAASPTEIDLVWSAVPGATGYTVLRGTASGGPYTVVGSPSSPSFASTGLSPATTYFFVVRATAGSLTSGNSGEVSTTTLLAAPTGVTATPVSPFEIDLSWTAVSGATGYVVERATTSGGPYTTIGTPTSASFASVALSPVTTYYYVVKATAGAVSSALSVEFSATTLLGLPTGLLATTISTSEIDLNWTPVTGATGYIVYRGTATGGPYTSVGTPTSTTFASTGLSSATSYYFVVRATASALASGLSSEVSAETLPAAPTGVSATAVAPTEIALSWNAVTGATGYVVLRATSSGGPFTSVGTTTSTSFTNTGLSANTTYYYVVQATDAAGNSANSATVSATTQLSAPTGLVATGKEESEIDLTWTAVPGATSYVILRSLLSGGPYTQVGTSTTTSFANTGCPEETTFYYVVEAVSGGVTGPSSAQASGIIQ